MAEAGEVKAGMDALGFEDVDEVLGGDIACIALSVLDLRGMAADAAKRTVKPAAAGVKGGHAICNPAAAAVVKMGYRYDVRHFIRDASEEPLYV